uniref:Venom protein n=1 Tax=Hadrurus spadix TaxID=141984 RepID=A0A1W7R947_9SCOR
MKTSVILILLLIPFLTVFNIANADPEFEYFWCGNSDDNCKISCIRDGCKTGWCVRKGCVPGDCGKPHCQRCKEKFCTCRDCPANRGK